MLYYFKKGKNTTEMQKQKICAVYGEGAVTDRMLQKWFAKFRAGDVSPDGAPRSGGPKLTAIQSRLSLRTINGLPCGREPTCSKEPNNSYW